MNTKLGSAPATAFVGIVLICLLSSSSCNRDDDSPSVNPSIAFVTDPGYTYHSDTVAISDTLLVGVVVRKGDDGLRSFVVQSVYDQEAPITVDSLPVGTDIFEFDKTILLRNVPGTEKWNFLVVENDGDVIRRSLTFTVQ